MPRGEPSAFSSPSKPNGGHGPLCPDDSATGETSKDRIIRVAAGLRYVAADDGLGALQATGVDIYQRDRQLVRVCRIKAKSSAGEIILVPGIVAVTSAMLGRELGRAARWEKIDRYGKIVRIDPPADIVEQIIAMVGEWPFPPLAGVIGCPTLRPDGSVLAAEGYDLATGLVLCNGIGMPPIPESPTRADGELAARFIEGLLTEFPFADNPSKSVAMSHIITPVVRGAMPVVPMHLAKAPQPGTGKSYLADVASMVATSERCAVIAVAPSPEETEKRLIGAALAGYPILTLDNCRDLLQGDFLCQVTERPLLQLRKLGSSDQIRMANNLTIFANGNNVGVADDLVRRSITATLDANVENPEKRTFKANPLAMVRDHRGCYIGACLTVCRSYIAADKPERLTPIESYEAWSDLVRSALVWLGYADPVDTMEVARGTDPAREDRAGVFLAWRDELKVGDSYLSADLVELADERYGYDQSLVRPALRSALLAVADKRGNAGQIDAKRLGKWLSKNENRIVDGHKLVPDRGDTKRPRWCLRRLVS